ncbi:membrane peptidoglycan carboxypeptidase [Pseudarthrobacter defluvii]|uniref:transglycosylase domain-containing protein n=1 Tax=Pseudarthrobacter defluvii TaxID=410837 RepID=UPI002789543B|nr:transglycosylase domain-containing protein [Pseudarthrobacter defluvii]MDQ0768001.1 membrane peptidoglycan carboxypeptidase [Pseudarthrobacter defluvii]
MHRNKALLPKLLAFVTVCVTCGILAAGLFVPATAVGASVAGQSISFFDQLPASLDVNPPARNSKVLAKDGSVIATFYSQNRVPVGLEQMSPFMRDAIVAIEDARFYEHGGVDPTGILRALAVTVQGGRQGASTITQQYVNNIIIESLVTDGDAEKVRTGASKTLGDKLREMKLAIALEKKYSKDQILAGYLNIVYFGNGAYGVQTAAREYFGVPAKDLDLQQSAALAAVVNRPVYYDPLTHPDHVVARRNVVLDKMLEQGLITAAQHGRAVASPLALDVHQTVQGCAAAASAPYFCDYIKRLILNDPTFGPDENARQKLLDQGGLTIRTTLDPGLQRVAQKEVEAALPPTDPLQRGSALVSVQPGTGKVLAMAQNTNYNPAPAPGNYMGNLSLPEKDANGNPLNGAGGFQIGSTMKPFVFAEWLRSGRSMATVLDGAVRVYKAGFPWKNSCGTTSGSYDPALGQTPLPNDDPHHYYPMTVLEGLYRSINTITFQSAARLDFCKIQEMATAAGVKNGHTNQPYDLSSIASLIGTQDVAPLDMANAYATFAAGGVHCDPIALESVTDAQGHDYPVPSANCSQTISPEVAAGVAYALKPVLVKGSGYKIPVNKDRDIFAKTGTTDGNTQTWTVGATTGIATASWFGSYKGFGPEWANQDITINGKYYPGVNGSDIAGTQWGHLMDAAAGEYQGTSIPSPPASMLREGTGNRRK